MPKATLHFTLPEEAEEFQTALDGSAWAAVVWDLDQYLRGCIKYNELSDEIEASLQRVRDKLHEEINNRDLSLG